MQLQSIRIMDFRNYSSLKLDSISRVNVLTGPNGSGKTNFLEAVYMLLQFHPLREAVLPELVRWEQNAFYLSGDIDGDFCEAGFSPQKKILKRNGESIQIHEFRKSHFAMPFMPDDITVVTGSPDERRNFMDRAFSALDADYQFALSRYQKALKQRNAQLKLNPAQAYIWNQELVKYGSVILEKRILYIQWMNKTFGKLYSELYGTEIILRYLNTFRIEDSIASSFQKSLEKNASAEKERRYTLTGPHRDNFEITGQEKTARVFASQGQKRTIALALRWSLLDCFEKLLGVKPVLLLDDVLLELDSERRNKLLEKMLTGYQSFLTATSLSIFNDLPPDTRIYSVTEGIMKPWEQQV